MNNVVNVSGVVVSDYIYTHEINGENFFTLKIKCNRASGASDLIDVFVSEDVFDTSYSLLNEYIYVEGSLRTHNINRHLVIGVFAEEIDILDINGVEPIDTNCIELDGYLCRKSKIRTTPGGRVICDCILAVNRGFSHSDYVPILFWGNDAELASKCSIGDNLVINGRFQSREYIKNNSVAVTHEVSVRELKIK